MTPPPSGAAMQACTTVAELDTRAVGDGQNRSAVDVGALRVLGGGVGGPAGAGVTGERRKVAAISRRRGSGELARRFSEVLAMEVLDRLHQLDLLAAGEQRSAAEVARIRTEMGTTVATLRAPREPGRGTRLRCIGAAR
ncbi:MAG: hypothetical protein ACT4NY_07365 [Pseudonocardiales bacterium]